MRRPTVRRTDPRLQFITETVERLVPGAAPAHVTVTVTVTETLPGTVGHDGEPQKHTWTGSPAGFAELVFTARYGRPDTSADLSPLAQSDAAHGRRDIGAMVDVLTHADHQLTHAPWYPARDGDLLHVHYEAMATMPAFGETYIVRASDHGLMDMRLLTHTCTEEDPEIVAGMVGCFATEQSEDPLYRPWFEAGAQRLTVIRDGRVVHGGGAK